MSWIKETLEENAKEMAKKCEKSARMCGKNVWNFEVELKSMRSELERGLPQRAKERIEDIKLTILMMKKNCNLQEDKNYPLEEKLNQAQSIIGNKTTLTKEELIQIEDILHNLNVNLAVNLESR